MKDKLSSVISAYLEPDKKTSLATALGAISDDDLGSFLATVNEESQALIAKGVDITPEELARLDGLTEVLTAVTTRQEMKTQESAAKTASETQARLAELQERVAAAQPDQQKQQGSEKSGLTPAGTDASASASHTDTNAATSATGQLEPPSSPHPAPQAAAPVDGELVAAYASPASFRSLASLPPGPLPSKMSASGLTSTFAATSSGQVTDRRYESVGEIGDALLAQMRTYPAYAPGNDQLTYLASYKRPNVEEYTVHNRDSDLDVIESVVAKGPQWDRSAGQFAAGWCAPSPNLYELCPYVTTLDGLVDLPEIVAARGGVRTTSGPNFATLYANAAIGQVLTEAQVISGTTKTCIEVDCPTFVETRLDVNPLCVTGNLLTTAGYPEYVERFIREAVAANIHKINLNILTRMVTASTAVDMATPPATGPVDTSSASWFLDAASLYAVWLRDRYRLSQNAVIEVVAPYWYLQQMEADLSRRNGVDLLTSRDRLTAAAAERNIRIQWVYDWQPMASTAAGAETRPLNAQILVYIPGTFVKLSAPVINLGTIHSAAQLATNQYTALFVEDGFNVLERCFESLVITVPTCPSGTTGAASGSCDSTP